MTARMMMQPTDLLQAAPTADGRRLALGAGRRASGVGNSTSHHPAGALRGTDYVTVPVAAAMTGYSVKAIRRKIEAGIWVEGREFRRAPDGHVLISVKGYELWVERGRA